MKLIIFLQSCLQVTNKTGDAGILSKQSCLIMFFFAGIDDELSFGQLKLLSSLLFRLLF